MGAEMTSAERLLEPLQSFHAAIRDAVVESCARQATEQLAQPAGDEGDTIYAIDRVGEDALVRALTNFPSDEPVCLISARRPVCLMSCLPYRPRSRCSSNISRISCGRFAGRECRRGAGTGWQARR